MTVAVAILPMLATPAAAAPSGPHYGPSMLVAQVPGLVSPNPSIAVGSDGVVYLAYAGWGGTTQSDIYFTKSSDGRTWTAPLRVNNDGGAAAQADPSIALDSRNNISLVWTDSRNGNNDVFYSKSTDGGLSFSTNVRVNDVMTNAQSDAHVAVDPVNKDLIHVVWTDTRSAATGPDIYYANSTDGGLSFNPSVRVNNDAGNTEQGQSAIAVGPNRDVYVVWRDFRTAGRGSDIYFSMSSDRGATWAPNKALNTDATATNQQEPVIAVDASGTLYVAWTDYRNANTAPDIFATRSTNGGTSFTAEVQVNDDTGAALQGAPAIATNAGKVVLSWMDYRTGGSTSWDIYASSSTDGVTWSPNVKVNDESVAAIQFNPTVGIDASGDVFAAWIDNRGSGLDVYTSTLDVVAPTANPGPAGTGDQGSSISFTGGASTDNLGIASYAWAFGDGSSATGAAGSHVYSNAGVYSATLTVWDYSGNSATATWTVTVRDTSAPVPRGSGDRTVDEGQALFFDGSASSDNVGVTSYLWDFGDGSSATTATANHIYAKSGTYTAKLTVTDAAGNTATSPFTVTVRPNGLLTYIEILGAFVGLLAILVGLLTWMLLGMRKKGREPDAASSGHGNPPPPPPPRDSDPLDMSLPPRNP
jgi:PKD repeat protein